MTDRRLQNLKRRVNRARAFPHNTCPASRHLHQIADHLATRGTLFAEPQHVAESIYAVLESLWKSRKQYGWPR